MTFARALMAITVRCLGDRRHEWALAMQAEFDIAAEAGQPLSFAFGCLLTAGRDMPAHEEGRFVMASHLLAVGILVPIAALLLASVVLGYPYLAPDEAGAAGLLGSGGSGLAVNAANQMGLPLLAMLTFALGLGHLYAAWAMLDRDWPRVAVAGRIGAAATATMMLFTGILFLSETCALPQAGAITIELSAVWLLVRWHAGLPDKDSRSPSTASILIDRKTH